MKRKTVAKGNARTRRFAKGDEVVFSRRFKEFVPENLKQYMGDKPLSTLNLPAYEASESKVSEPSKVTKRKGRRAAAIIASTPKVNPVPASTPAPAPVAAAPARVQAPARVAPARVAPARVAPAVTSVRNQDASGYTPEMSRQATQAQMAATAAKIADQKKNRDALSEQRRKDAMRKLGAIGEEIVGNLPGGASRGYAKGGKVKSASARADGIAKRGKTRAR